MTDKFFPLDVHQLYKFIFTYPDDDCIFGIPSNVFYKANDNKYKSEWIGRTIDTPLGVAAGPHSQLAQNIICAWLCGARYIELKTIQTLDEINVSKPCIDMQDEGYNCEWSQELKIRQAFEEYLKAWIFIHILKKKFIGANDRELGTLFNMSIGYDMKGITNNNVQWFIDKMHHCKQEKAEIIKELKSYNPEIEKIFIDDCISDNITLSTMHGCPPDEIEKIGYYLLESKKLNTILKLNPTLLGAEKLRNILNNQLKFNTEVPDYAFDHDLKYKDAVSIIKSLRDCAKKNNLFFGIKLSNTLECINNKAYFSEKEKMMYMSGRALHPITINLAAELQNTFNGKLKISFSAGGDCFNIQQILNCGLSPVTVCSDLLKPGGYGRLSQYLETLSTDNHWFINADTSVFTENLNQYAKQVVADPRYQKTEHPVINIKINKQLEFFDCIGAPCVNTCPDNQDIPGYMYDTYTGKFDKAFVTINKTNPFPHVLGAICNHQCQYKCTRINYDNNLQIREIKKFIAESEHYAPYTAIDKQNNINVAVIGAGPSGLSCAYYLAIAGFNVHVFETKAFAGGMVADTIPAFRLSDEALAKDISRIVESGVKIFFNNIIDDSSFKKIQKDYEYIYIALGSQQAKKLNLEGENAEGVFNSLDFLSSVKKGKLNFKGKKIAVIGGGNTAIDVARTAKRLTSGKAKIILIYRRSIQEMPAEYEEIIAAINEGVEIMEHTAPDKILTDNNKVKGLVCSIYTPGDKDQSGRAMPFKKENSAFIIDVDTVIPAIGQNRRIDFIGNEMLEANPITLETKIKNVFIGGDAHRGAKNIVTAVADGRKVAENIIISSGLSFKHLENKNTKDLKKEDYLYKRSRRKYSDNYTKQNSLNINEQQSSKSYISENEAINEAARCLFCDEICYICVTVCPNRANYSYETSPCSFMLQKAVRNENDIVSFENDKIFSVKQKYQVLNISDLCNECGNCTTFCPTSGAPFRDKPKFYLTKESFRFAENGFFIEKKPDKITLFFKQNNEMNTLTLQQQIFLFKNDQIIATFRQPDFQIINVSFLNQHIHEYHFIKAAEMSVLLKAAEKLY